MLGTIVRQKFYATILYKKVIRPNQEKLAKYIFFKKLCTDIFISLYNKNKSLDWYLWLLLAGFGYIVQN